jgi:hypothetical protein
MKLSALVQEARYVQKTEGVSEAARQFDDLARAQTSARQAAELAARQTDIQERSITRLGSKLDTYVRKNDPLTKALREVERGEALVAAARARGIEVTEAHLGALDRARERHARLSLGLNDNAKSAGLLRHEWLNLSRQMQDVGTMAAMGASPMQILASQGAQVFDILSSAQAGAGAAARDFGATLLRYAVHPAALAAAAAGTAALAYIRWKEQTDALTVSLNGLGRQSGLTLSQVNRLAEDNAGRAGLSNATARGLAGQMLSAGVPGGSIGGAIGVAGGFSRGLGLDLEEAGKALAAALAEPAKGADELARRYGLVSFAEREHIKELAAVGDRAAASAELLRILSDRIAEMEDPTSRLAKLWETLKKGFFDGLDKFGQAIDRAIDGPERIAQRERERAQRAAEAARGAQVDRDAERTRDLARFREDADLAVREIGARTFAERDAVATQRAWTQTLRETHDAVKASIAAESERAKLLAESVRKVDDLARNSADNLRLTQLSPFERRMAEIDIAERDFRAQTLPAALETTAGAAQNLTSALNAAASAVSGRFSGRLIPLEDWRGDGLGRAREAIATIESGGNYSAIGPRTRAGDRAYGRYQVMGRNIGPWTMDALGRALSPSQFLASPTAQDAVFDRQFATSMMRYGNMNDAASVWFTGRPFSMGAGARDSLGTSGAQYVDRFRSALGANDNLSARAGAAFNDQREAARFEAIAKPLREANAEIERQRALLAAQADVFGRSTEQTARAAKQQELLNQFQQAGVPLNAELRASIAATAENYGRLARETEEAAERQRRLVNALDEVRSVAKETLGSLISDLAHGRSAAEALGAALSRIGDRLISSGADTIVDNLFGRAGKVGGGLFGDLLSGVFSAFDEGGIVGAPGGRTMRAPLTAFIGAPQFAAGGVVGGARPIFAHDGELILNLAMQRNAASNFRAALGSGNDNRRNFQPSVINFNFPPGTDVRAFKQSEGQIVAMVGRAMARGQRYQ